MALSEKEPAALAMRAGSECSLLGGLNNSENNESPPELQAQSSADDARRRLELLRVSAWSAGDTAAIHVDLALGCLQLADDDGLTHHVRRAVNAMRAFAKLTNEILVLRTGGAA
jgi:hypothetical protein